MGSRASPRFGESFRARRHHIDVLGHSLRLRVHIDGLRPEEDDVLAADEEAPDLAKHVCQGNFLVGHDLAHGGGSV